MLSTDSDWSTCLSYSHMCPHVALSFEASLAFLPEHSQSTTRTEWKHGSTCRSLPHTCTQMYSPELFQAAHQHALLSPSLHAQVHSHPPSTLEVALTRICSPHPAADQSATCRMSQTAGKISGLETTYFSHTSGCLSAHPSVLISAFCRVQQIAVAAMGVERCILNPGICIDKRQLLKEPHSLPNHFLSPTNV